MFGCNPITLVNTPFLGLVSCAKQFITQLIFSEQTFACGLLINGAQAVFHSSAVTCPYNPYKKNTEITINLVASSK